MLQKTEQLAPVADPGGAPEAPPADPGGSPELVRRSVAMIMAQSSQGAASGLLMGGLFGCIYVPAAGWGLYLGWMLPFAAAMVGRQHYFRRLVAREGPSAEVLQRIAVVSAFTGWLTPASVPLFAGFLHVTEVGVLTVLAVGWSSSAVAVLAVQPRVYALYLTASYATVYLAWVRHASAAELLLVAASMLLAGRLMVKLGQAVWNQLRDTVRAADQNAALVAQLRDALARQQEAQRARSRFLGAASHDLRQPVQALLFLSDIFRKSTDAVRRDAMAQQIVRTGESIDGMFRHLVDFAQIDAGTMKAVLQPVQLQHLVAAAASGFAEKCAARGLHFRTQLPAACTVAADPVLLERMLRNFLDNAFKYSLQGEILLQVRREGAQVVLTVADQGVGMDEDDLAQACNAFHRGRSAALAEAEGIGLGLAISRHMADLMQSDLQLASRPGEGTRVTITLQAAAEEAPQPVPATVPAAEAPLAGCLVAVLENDRLAREALTAWLQQAGAGVAAAQTVGQLRQSLAALGQAPHLLLADYRLAGLRGDQAIETLRAEYGPLPALVISGEPDITERGLPYPVLQKPVTPDRLMEALRAAVPWQAARTPTAATPPSRGC